MNLLRVNLTRETFERTDEHPYQPMNQTQDRIKLLEHQYRKTDQFIISNEHLLEAKQNEPQLEDLPHGNRSHGKSVIEMKKQVKVHSY